VAVLFAAVLAATCGRTTAPQPPGSTPDLVLITIDTLRADRVGRGLTPTLDALAARGVQFLQARSAVPLTLPSHVTMMTGVLPPEHGVRENGTHVFTGTPAPAARLLKERGYQTAAFVGAYVLDRRFGLADGFDHYDDQIARDPEAVHRLEAERPANEVVDRATAWLRGVRPGSESTRTGVRVDSDPLTRTGVRVNSDPVFLWVHLYDPHAPYRGSYDEEVRFADAQVGRLLHDLRTQARDPIVIVAGDHGESLGEHGERTHGMLAYDAALRVPLIVAGPGIGAARRTSPVSLSDIAPTLLELAGVQVSNRSGRSLLAADGDPEREIYSETEYPHVAGWSPVYALAQDRWKLILSHGPELYDLASDPTESKNVAAARQALVSAMAARLEVLRTPARERVRRSAAPAVAERLRALGYVAGSADPPRPGDGPNPAQHIASWGSFEDALSALATADRTRAVRVLRELASSHPDAPVFQSTYARALSDGGAFHEALAIYRRAVTRWPNDAMLFHELAVAARAAGRSTEAMNAEQAALAIEPNLPSAHNGVGLLMTDAGRHAEAASAFESAAKGDPTNAEYWVNLANARAAAQQPRAAEEAYRRAMQIDSRSPDAANGLGVLLVQQGRAAEAIPWFERALESSPAFVEARLNLGIAYQESGQRDRARDAYRQVLAQAPASARERRAAADLLRSLAR